MRVIKFFAKSIDEDKIEPYVWYIEDRLKRSEICKRIEEFLRKNKLICHMSSFILYINAKEYEANIKDQLDHSKNKYNINTD